MRVHQNCINSIDRNLETRMPWQSNANVMNKCRDVFAGYFESSATSARFQPLNTLEKVQELVSVALFWHSSLCKFEHGWLRARLACTVAPNRRAEEEGEGGISASENAIDCQHRHVLFAFNCQPDDNVLIVIQLKAINMVHILSRCNKSNSKPLKPNGRSRYLFSTLSDFCNQIQSSPELDFHAKLSNVMKEKPTRASTVSTVVAHSRN